MHHRPAKILETILRAASASISIASVTRISSAAWAYVCEQEGFDYDDEALAIVARHAKGGMRDALSTLEQLSVFGNGTACGRCPLAFGRSFGPDSGRVCAPLPIVMSPSSMG
ncbi:MAG: hypothetical protein ACLTYW_00390 [Collinsella sp.]